MFSTQVSYFDLSLNLSFNLSDVMFFSRNSLLMGLGIRKFRHLPGPGSERAGQGSRALGLSASPHSAYRAYSYSVCGWSVGRACMRARSEVFQYVTGAAAFVYLIFHTWYPW